MGHTLVKILTDDDGMKIKKPVWHLSMHMGGGEQAMCTGEYYGFGESAVTYDTKGKEKGGITCPECLTIIKIIKNIKL